MTKRVNGYDDVEGRVQTESERWKTVARSTRDENCVLYMAVVIVSCPFEKDAVEGMVDNALWRNDIDELNEGQLAWKTVCND